MCSNLGQFGLWFKAPKVSIEIKRIQVGMLGEQGGNSMRVREKEDEEKIEGAKSIFCLSQKQKQKQKQKTKSN